MDLFVFASEQWLLISTLLVLIYIFMWREKIKGGMPLSAHVVTQLLNRDEAILIDVREAADFKAGHIVDAINIPHGKVVERIIELEKYREKVLVLADKMGQHAGAVGRQLADQEFQVRRLEGGMTEWQNQKLPLVKGKG